MMINTIVARPMIALKLSDHIVIALVMISHDEKNAPSPTKHTHTNVDDRPRIGSSWRGRVGTAVAMAGGQDRCH